MAFSACTSRPATVVRSLVGRRPSAAVRAAPARASVKVCAAAVEAEVKYETMIVLNPTLDDESRDKELAKFEAFLLGRECSNIDAKVRGRQRMSYPIKGNDSGIYALFTYNADVTVAQSVQKLLSTPAAGEEDIILRHMTFRI